MNSIARNSFEIFLVRAFNQATSIVIGIAIARLLGPAGKGLYTYVASAMTLVAMAAAGQGVAFAYQSAKRQRSAPVVHRAILRTTALFTVPIASALIIVAAVEPSQRLLLAVAAALPFVLYAGFSNSFFLSKSDVRSSNLKNIVQYLILVAVVPLLFFGGGLPALLATWIASQVGAALYALLRFRSYLHGEPPRTDPYPFKAQLVFGLKASLNALVEELNLRIDVFIILAMLGARQVGIYSIGVGMASLLWLLNRPVTAAAFGRIASSDEKEAAALTARCMRHSLALIAPVSIVIVIVGPPLVTLVYGNAFAPSGIVLRLLSPGIIAYCLMPLLATFFVQQLGRPMIPLALSTVSTIICAVATVTFIPRYGIAAGAVASSLSYVTVVAIAATLFIRRTRMSAAQLFILNRDDLRQYSRLLGGVAARIGRLTEALVR
jgi:O-antigen/teichoic acid export membrane protein